MKILLPVDGTPSSLHAVQHALRLRREGLDANFVLANVQTPPSLYEVVTAHDPAVLDDMRRAAGADLLAPAEALLEGAGAAWESEVAGGEPGHVLVDLVETYGCDAVVMGAQEEGEGIGPVAMALLEHCPVPVTVVRAPAAAEPADAQA
ncbi:universal stress protein UspA [Rubrivivax gelatinosus]|uniref:universal stress protein n=1 Tax=Rubrivivax gelatinosus TaxID=28068 RepID=UPI001905251F|nr:universal stress protein [Rubrivivax gelatinosus]MBK1613285.1 universal stress protein UspA [Rubrivivax gelatinosus]